MSGSAVSEEAEISCHQRGHLFSCHDLALGAAIYFFITLAFFWPLVLRLFTHIYSHDQFAWPELGGDEIPFLWMYWWVQKALSEGLNMLHCDWVLPPTGANLVFRSIPFVPVILTFPAGRMLGPVAGNNIMMLLMIFGGAYAHFIFLLRGLRLSFVSSLLAGALFGFSPYFIWKAGGHYNLIGAYVWGPALAVLFLSYVRSTFTIRGGLLFALMVWLTFWTSLAEFYMLGIVCGLQVIVGEIHMASRGKWAERERLIFFLPTLLGLVSLIIVLYGPDGHVMQVDLRPGVSLKDLIPSAKLSIFSWLGLPNRTEVVLPHTVFWLMFPGIWLLFKERRRTLWLALAMIILTLALTVDPFNVPSALVRSLPMGGGFRFMQRFFPFVLFYATLVAGYGVEWGVRHWNGRCRGIRVRPVLAAGLIVFACLECYPFLMALCPVRLMNMDPAVHASLDRNSFLLVLPPENYYPVYDSYQVTLDLPAVHLTHWDHMSESAMRLRNGNYPSVYATNLVPGQAHQMNPRSPDFFHELMRLKIRYVILPDGADPRPFEGKSAVIFFNERETLLEIRPDVLLAPGNDPNGA